MPGHRWLVLMLLAPGTYDQSAIVLEHLTRYDPLL